LTFFAVLLVLMTTLNDMTIMTIDECAAGTAACSCSWRHRWIGGPLRRLAVASLPAPEADMLAG
jgi:hypothetical protein